MLMRMTIAQLYVSKHFLYIILKLYFCSEWYIVMHPLHNTVILCGYNWCKIYFYFSLKMIGTSLWFGSKQITHMKMMKQLQMDDIIISRIEV